VSGGTTILVVDDEPSIRLLCRVNLELEGYTVVEAGSIAEARARIDEDHPSVLLLDVHVGTDDGRELLRQVKAEHPELRVALLTGTMDANLIAEEGADAVIPKPFTLDVLTDTVARLADVG
jgi:DNA-binding NtrC family response regulator